MARIVIETPCEHANHPTLVPHDTDAQEGEK